MKKVLVSCIIACMFCLPAFAQENKDRDKQYAEWQQKIKDEVKLSDDQVSKWNALDAEYKDKMNATMQATNLDKDAQKAKMYSSRSLFWFLVTRFMLRRL